MPDPRAGWSSFLFPLTVATRASEVVLRSFASFLEAESPPEEKRAEAPDWITPNQVHLELASMRLRAFAAGDARAIPFVVVTPLALHGAVIADLAPGHSVMERLLGEEIAPLFLTECKSASAEMRYLSIDSYLADLNIVIDELGGRANLIGLCQGGWLALMLAARFPTKVASLVLAGAPVDVDACPSRIVDGARSTAPALIEGLIEAGNGLVLGRDMRDLWQTEEPDEDGIAALLECEGSPSPELLARFAAWNAFTVDLPGVYYRETVERLFRDNALAKSTFCGLGRTLRLSDVSCPLMVLAGERDDIVPPQQVLAAVGLVGTPPKAVDTIVAPAGHLGLLMGAKVLAGPWRKIAAWLAHHGRGRTAGTGREGRAGALHA